jgi:hypothetical protein
MGRKIFTIVLFAVMMFVLGVTAAKAKWVSLPDIQSLPSALSTFFPIIFRSADLEIGDETPPSGVLYIFPSKARTTGDAGGRIKIQRICPTEDPDAHFCSIREIENAWDSIGIYYDDQFPFAWVDDYYETYNWVDSQHSYSPVNSCGGWLINDGKFNGGIINTGREYRPGECDADLPVACCKRIP